MPHPSDARSPRECDGFDYSTPEAQQALTDSLDLILEIREEQTGPLARRVALYERTLGLAVIPVLLVRAALYLSRKIKKKPRARP
jgi:hypothetical protein